MPAKREAKQAKPKATAAASRKVDDSTTPRRPGTDKLRPDVKPERTTAPPSSADPRVVAFLKQTDAFASTQYGSSVFEVDPYDVESLHASTCDAFEDMVDRATTPGMANNRGRMLLVLGDSGTGKTHLLRGFRRHVQENGHGLVAYAQLNSNATDYARYLLQNVIASLSKPYSIPSGKKTGLNQLAHGLALLAGGTLRKEILRLSEDDWSESNRDSIHQHINRLVDGLLAKPELSVYDPDLLRILLYTLCPEQAIVPRLYKYLNCEQMTDYDRQWIGGIAPRVDTDAPARMIREIANLAYTTQNWCFVLMLDQAELSGQEVAPGTVFRRAFDTLYSIVNMVPSAIAVIACLSDLYYEVRSHLAKFAIDRLERDPGVQRLQLNRSYTEIQEIVGQRLSRIFDESGVVHRPPPLTFPFPEPALRGMEGLRTRDVLEWCQDFHTRCLIEGRLLSAPGPQVEGSAGVPRDTTLDQIAGRWNDAISEDGIEIPEDDDKILTTVVAAARACAMENHLEITTSSIEDDTTHIQLTDNRNSTKLRIAVTNKHSKGGGFRSQIENLCEGRRGAVPVAIRTWPYPQGPACEKALDKLAKAGGRAVYVDVSILRTLATIATFTPNFPVERVTEWRRRDRPISTLPAIRQIFELDQLAPAVAHVTTPPSDTAEEQALDEEPARKSSKPRKTKRSA